MTGSWFIVHCRTELHFLYRIVTHVEPLFSSRFKFQTAFFLQLFFFFKKVVLFLFTCDSVTLH